MNTYNDAISGCRKGEGVGGDRCGDVRDEVGGGWDGVFDGVGCVGARRIAEGLRDSLIRARICGGRGGIHCVWWLEWVDVCGGVSECVSKSLSLSLSLCVCVCVCVCGRGWVGGCGRVLDGVGCVGAKGIAEGLRDGLIRARFRSGRGGIDCVWWLEWVDVCGGVSECVRKSLSRSLSLSLSLCVCGWVGGRVQFGCDHGGAWTMFTSAPGFAVGGVVSTVMQQNGKTCVCVCVCVCLCRCLCMCMCVFDGVGCVGAKGITDGLPDILGIAQFRGGRGGIDSVW